MGKILSQEEVRALLQQPGQSSDSDEVPPAADVSVSDFDFRERENLARPQLRYLHALHERFAQQLGASLTAYMRTAVDVRLDALEQMSSRRFLQGLHDPTGIFVATATGGEAVLAIFDPSIGFVLVDRLLGGSGEKSKLDRAITQIEQGVLEGAVEVVLQALQHAWSAVFEINFQVTARETRPALLSLDVPADGFVVLQLGVTLGAGESAVEGTIQLAAPVELAQRLVTTVQEGSGDEDEAEPSDEEIVTMESLLLPIPIRLTVDLAARGVTAGDLLKLEEGSVLDLGRAVHELAPLRIGKTTAFEGSLVLTERRRAVEIKALSQEMSNE